MDFTVLIRSPNYSQCKRGLRLLNCELALNPIETLNNFSLYVEPLISIFFNHENGSIYHASTTPILVTSAVEYIDELNEQTIYEILCFLIECCRHCRSPELAFYLSLNVYSVSFYSDFIEKLMTKSHASFLKLKLIDVLTLIELNIGTELLSSNIDFICDLINRDPEFSANAFLKLFLSNNSNSIVYQCIKRSCQKNSPMLSYLPTNVAILGSADKEMTNLLTSHSKLQNPPLNGQFYTEAQIIKLSQSPISVIINDLPVEAIKEKPSLQHRISFGAIPKLNTITDDANGLSTIINKSSPYEAVKALTSMGLRKVKIDGSPNNDHKIGRIRTQSAILITPKNLHAYGVKRGGIGHNTWQKRYFEFYSSARCVFWRDDENSKSIKGVLVLPENTRVTPNISHKGLNYHLIIEPGDGQKKYDIAFEKENVCNVWCQALQSVATGFI